MKKTGTTGTTLLKTSRARRKVRTRKVMRRVPQVVCAAPNNKLSLFATLVKRFQWRTGLGSSTQTALMTTSGRLMALLARPITNFSGTPASLPAYHTAASSPSRRRVRHLALPPAFRNSSSSTVIGS